MRCSMRRSAPSPGRPRTGRNPASDPSPYPCCACIFSPDPLSVPHLSRPPDSRETDATVPLLPADPARGAEGGRNRLPPADAARRHDAAGVGRHLRLPAARAPRAAQDRADRARGAEPCRRDRDADADHPVGGALARERALRGLRQGDAADRGPPRARDALRPDQRGDDHRDLPVLCALLQGPAAEPLPHPVEVPGRGAPALRADARPRIPDEGRLFVRRRLRRRQALLQQDVRGLSADLRAARIEIDPDGRRHRSDRRQSQPRVHHPRLDRRVRGLLPQGLSGLPGARRLGRTSTTSRGFSPPSTSGPRSTRRRPRSTTPRRSARSRPTGRSRRAASKWATSSISAPSIPSR